MRATMLPRHYANLVTSEESLHEEYARLSNDQVFLSQFTESLVTKLCREFDIVLLISLANKIGWEKLITIIKSLLKTSDIAIYLRAKIIDELFRSLPELKKASDIGSKLREFEEALNLATYQLDDFEKHITGLNKEDADIIFKVCAIKYEVSRFLKKIEKTYAEHKEIANHFHSLVANRNLIIFAKLKLIERFIGDIDSLTYIDGLLSCAQIANRKNRYNFNPTVVNNVSQFNEYLQTIVNFNRSNPNVVIHERFLYVSSHWVCGEIRIEKDEVKLLIIDSVSMGKDRKITFDTPKLIYALNQAFPGKTVYFPAEKRQHDLESCWMYAINDLTHLYSISQLLTIPDLFVYFEKQNSTGIQLPFIKLDSVLSIELETAYITVSLVKLPLSFLTTMQSTILYQSKVKDNVTIPSILSERTPEEIAQPVNKKGQDIRTSIQGIFKKHRHFKTTENLKLIHKTKRIALENVIFVTTHSLSEIHSAMKVLTLSTLSTKLQSAIERDNDNHTKLNND